MKFTGKTSQARAGDVLITQYEAGVCVIVEIQRGCLGCVFYSMECDRARLCTECPSGIVFHPSAISSEELEYHRSLLTLKGELL